MDKRNILMIVVDTLRADYLGCYGPNGAGTPRIDQAAARGIRFERVFSTSDFTAPAFASMFTSVYPWQHGVYDFAIKTLPASPYLEALARNGYSRKAVVDFGFFKNYLKKSFDDMDALVDLGANWSTEAPILEIRRTLDWIRDQREKPFFCFLHISPPHTPYRFPSGFYAELVDEPEFANGIEAFRKHALAGPLFPEPTGGRVPEEAIERFNLAYRRINQVTLEEPMRAFVRYLYGSEVRLVDQLVGTLIDGLDNLSLLDSTLVSLSSDHGEQLWEHGGYGHGISALYNEVIRTPWVLFGAGVPAATVSAVVSHTSLLPTLVDLAGIDMPPEAQAKSARSLIDGVESPAPGLVAFTETKRHIAATGTRHKLITRNRRRGSLAASERVRYLASRIRRRLQPLEARCELYDLIDDPAEAANIAGRRRDVVERLEREIGSLHRRPVERVEGWEALTADEEARIKRELEGLGYY